MIDEIKFLREVGRKIHEARVSTGLSLRAVEDSTGVSNGYVSQIENGRVQHPSFMSIFNLLKFFGIYTNIGTLFNQFPKHENKVKEEKVPRKFKIRLHRGCRGRRRLMDAA